MKNHCAKYAKKIGHNAAFCYHRLNLNHQPQLPPEQWPPTSVASQTRPQTPAFAAMFAASSSSNTHATPDTSWVLDSGATHHFTPDFSCLENPLPFQGDDQVLVGSAKTINISSVGNVLFQSHAKPLHLNHVFHTPAISKHLISVTKLCSDNRVFVEFYPSHFLVKDLNSKQILLWGHLEDGLYKLQHVPASTMHSSPSAYTTQLQDANLWHQSGRGYLCLHRQSG